LEAASRELGTVDSTEEGSSDRLEQWKILYLALVAGLRYREIDNLRVRDVSPENRRISIRSHGEYQPKTLSSEADVTVSEHAGSVLKDMLRRTKGDWFISESKSSKSPQYRTGAHHDALLGWLRNYEERGIKPLAESHKPLHELRKEAGTLVNSQFGLNEAKTILRHSSITTTAAYYLGSKGEITTGLG
jgi:integrase